MNINILPADLCDLDALDRLEQKVFDIVRYHVISKKQYRYLLTKGKCEIFKATLGDNLVGVAVIFYRINSKMGRLYSLAVDPDYQGHSIGKQLCQHAEQAIRDKGYNGILCEMRADDHRLLSFYQKLGFKIISELEDYYADHAEGLKLKKLFT